MHQMLLTRNLVIQNGQILIIHVVVLLKHVNLSILNMMTIIVPTTMVMMRFLLLLQQMIVVGDIHFGINLRMRK